MEERKLRVLEAYNAVTEQLATIKAESRDSSIIQCANENI